MTKQPQILNVAVTRVQLLFSKQLILAYLNILGWSIKLHFTVLQDTNNGVIRSNNCNHT